MQHKKTLILLFLGALMLFVGTVLWLLRPQPVKAQCGSQASSCKTCHEVQAQKPVNNDGSKWHESHAFGDFCVFCHAGNQQATDKIAAHTGMVPPLSDGKSACQSCHSADLDSRVQVYAAILKVTPGAGGSTANQGAATGVAAQSGGAAQSGVSTEQAAPLAATQAAAQPAVQPTAQRPVQPTAQPAVSAPVDTAMVVDDPNVVDYAQRYNEIVLGQNPTNWGNVILVVLTALIAVGGGGFAVFNEMKLRMASGTPAPVAGEYPSEVVAMLPDIAKLKPQSRKSLRNILRHPRQTDKVLGMMDSLLSDEKTEE